MEGDDYRQCQITAEALHLQPNQTIEPKALKIERLWITTPFDSIRSYCISIRRVRTYLIRILKFSIAHCNWFTDEAWIQPEWHQLVFPITLRWTTSMMITLRWRVSSTSSINTNPSPFDFHTLKEHLPTCIISTGKRVPTNSSPILEWIRLFRHKKTIRCSWHRELESTRVLGLKIAKLDRAS